MPSSGLQTISIVASAIVFLVHAAADATITPAPVPKAYCTIATGDDYIGYTYDPKADQDGEYRDWRCLSESTWTSAGMVGECHHTRSNPLWGIGCSAESVVIGLDRNYTCSGTGSQTKCYTGTVFAAPDAPQSAVMNYQCWPSYDAGDNWKATRTLMSPEETKEFCKAPEETEEPRSSSSARLGTGMIVLYSVVMVLLVL